MALGRINMEVYLLDIGNGWLETPEVEITHGQWVDDPSKSRDGEPGRLYGPAKVTLAIAPDKGRTLQVR
jgi:hypothetical protein